MAGYHLSYGHRAVGLFFEYFATCPRAAFVARGFFYGINCIPENICLVCAQVNGRGCMDVWTLYFLVTFATGQSMLMKNIDEFETKSDCMATGAAKGEGITMSLVQIYGIPAQGFYYCALDGSEV